jgi:hydrogenase/urease accessory protein HupE
VAGDRVKAPGIDGGVRAAGLGLALVLCATQAHAHLVETGLGPVYDGIAHFALTPEDLIPALAVAVLAGLRGRGHARRVILVLPLAWLLGGLLGAASILALPGLLSWLPFLVLGGLVAADFRLPEVATTAIAAAVGLFLGLANGDAMAQAGAGIRGVVGIVGAVFVVTTLGAASVVAWQKGWLRIAWRVAGSWIAATGLLMLGWHIRGT